MLIALAFFSNSLELKHEIKTMIKNKTEKLNGISLVNNLVTNLDSIDLRQSIVVAKMHESGL